MPPRPAEAAVSCKADLEASSMIRFFFAWCCERPRRSVAARARRRLFARLPGLHLMGKRPIALPIPLRRIAPDRHGLP